MVRYNAVLFFGAPRCGKGTQAQLLARHDDYFHFSTGEELRRTLKNPITDIEKKVKESLDKGELAPDELIFKLFDESLKKYIKEREYDPESQILILDGIPRVASPVSFVNERVTIKKIIYLDISLGVLSKRAEKRAKEEGRPEDIEPKIVTRRYEIFKEQTLPILGYYDSNLIVKIDGSKGVNEIHQNILNALDGI